MPVTFSAGSNINLIADTTVPNAGGGLLVMGWWNPAATTNHRTLWSTSSVNILELNSAAQLRLTLDATTTDGVYTAAGLALATDTWYHVSTLLTTKNASTAAVRMWVGVGTDVTTEQAVTVTTAPSGNFSGGSTFYIANAASTGGATTFLGAVADVSYLSEDVVGITGALGISTAGAITDDEADFVYKRWVLPHWLGTPDPTQAIASSASDGVILRHFPLDSIAGTSPVTPCCNRAIFANVVRNSSLSATVTNSNPVASQDAAPRRLPNNWPIQAPFWRR